MKSEEFIRQVQLFTGSEVKGHDQIDHESLATILHDDTTILDRSCLNELLLLVHKDRVERPLFDHFLGPDCTVGRIPDRRRLSTSGTPVIRELCVCLPDALTDQGCK